MHCLKTTSMPVLVITNIGQNFLSSSMLLRVFTKMLALLEVLGMF